MWMTSLICFCESGTSSSNTFFRPRRPHSNLDDMTGDSAHDLEAAIAAQQELVDRQGDVVRSLKAEVKEGKVLKHEVDAAIEKLKGLKVELGEKLKAFQVCTILYRARRANAFVRRAVRANSP